MNRDIREIYEEWVKDPEHNVRQIVGNHGREKLQLRIEQGPFIGILQMELDGRPDGKRPHECAFALEHYENLVEQESKYRLGHKQCEELFEEGLCIYERYTFLLQLADFPRVIRDTEHNMRLFRFVHKYARHHDDQQYLERFWPYLIRIHGTARAMEELSEGGDDKALTIVQETRDKVKELDNFEVEELEQEKETALEALDELENEILQHRKPTKREELQAKLKAALRNEEYEIAAILRDKIKALPKTKD